MAALPSVLLHSETDRQTDRLLVRSEPPRAGVFWCCESDQVGARRRWIGHQRALLGGGVRGCGGEVGVGRCGRVDGVGG
jgi:hypothetical protein